MSETPRQAALLARLFSADADRRAAVLSELIADPVEAASAGLGPLVRARLADTDPVVRLAAAEYLWRVSGDPAPAAAELCDRFRDGGTIPLTAMPLLQSLGRHAIGPLVAYSRDSQNCFDAEAAEFHRWAARTTLTAGPDGVAAWCEMMRQPYFATASLLLAELAELAPKIDCATDAVLDAVRRALAVPKTAPVAGAALWRLTWRVNRDWVAALDMVVIENEWPDVFRLITAVVCEHLGRRPDLTPLARALLVRLVGRDTAAATRLVARLARAGGRGWAVLLLALGDPPADDAFPAPDNLKAAILRQAVGSPACRPLVHPHAHRVLAARVADPETASDDLTSAALNVLADVGPAAAPAFPDLLTLIGREPQFGPAAVRAALAVAPDYPSAAARVLRELNAVPAFSVGAFEHLARLLHALDPDAGPAAVGDSSVSDVTASRLLDLDLWQRAPADVRTRHAALVADLLESPRPEIRLRAADALKHYLPELPAVWPSVVAALAAADEKPAALLLPYFRALRPVADPMADDLEDLFADPNPDRAARAAVGLWRVRRWDRIAVRVRDQALAEPVGRGWDVFRGAAARAGHDHGLLEDLAALLADAPAPVRAAARRLTAVPDSALDADLTAALGRSDPAAPGPIDWVKVRDLAVSGGAGPAPLVVLGVMSGVGCDGWSILKIWLIKYHRERVSGGLALAKVAVERVAATLEGTPTREHRRAAVREFFRPSHDLPAEVCGLLSSPHAWFRWAGLELADAWGLLPREYDLWVDDRRRDASPLVRDRAARVTAGV